MDLFTELFKNQRKIDITPQSLIKHSRELFKYIRMSLSKIFACL